VALRVPSACEEAVAAAVDHTGRLDVVVNAVGVVAFGPVDELSVDTMEELFLTNTFVPIMVARAALDARVSNLASREQLAPWQRTMLMRSRRSW